MDTKRCARCGETKLLDHFFFRDKARTKPQSQCKDCTNAYKRAWYTVNAEHHKHVLDVAKRRRIALNVSRVREYLTGHLCVDCGETDPVVLEFDHVRGQKSANISKMLRDRPWYTILDELEKCDVRCANCHRRRTARQYGWHAYLSPL